jgi:hypothetical protein
VEDLWVLYTPRGNIEHEEWECWQWLITLLQSKRNGLFQSLWRVVVIGLAPFIMRVPNYTYAGRVTALANGLGVTMEVRQGVVDSDPSKRWPIVGLTKDSGFGNYSRQYRSIDK